MDLTLLASLLKDFGLLATFVMFCVWKDWRREERLQRRIEGLEKEHKDVILPLVEKCTAVIVQNTEAMSRGNQALGLLERVLHLRDACVNDCFEESQ